MLCVSQMAGVRNKDRGEAAQPLDDLPRLVEPPRMGVAGGKKAIRWGVARILDDDQNVVASLGYADFLGAYKAQV